MVEETIEQVEEFEERPIFIKRVSKVTKGGKKIAFSSLVVTGNKKGRVGYGMGKAAEVPLAIEKAKKKAKKNLVDLCIINETIPYEIIGKYKSTKVLLKPAAPGTGVIAGGTVRNIMELAGVNNVLTKVLGSKSHLNVVKACFNAIENIIPPEKIANLRGKTLSEIWGIKKKEEKESKQIEKEEGSENLEQESKQEE